MICQRLWNKQTSDLDFWKIQIVSTLIVITIYILDRTTLIVQFLSSQVVLTVSAMVKCRQRRWGTGLLICEAERLLKRCQWENRVYLTKSTPADDINTVWDAVLFLCLKKKVKYICKTFKRHCLLKLLITDSMLWISPPYLIKYNLVLAGTSMQGVHKHWPGLRYVKLGKIPSLKSVVKLFQTSVF